MRIDSPNLLSGPGPGPVARFFGAVAAALALTISLILGFAFFLIVLGVGLVIGIVVWAKMRRLRRELAAQHGKPTEPGPTDAKTTVLEGEYVVIQKTQDRDR